MMKNIFLIRHTKPEIEQGRVYGQTDLALAASHPEEMLRITKQLPNLPEDSVIYSSPLQRCHLLAKFLKNYYHITEEIQLDKRLAEIDLGTWEMQKLEEIHESAWRTWRDDIAERPAPAGESFAQVAKRATESFYEILKEEESENIIITAHGGVIRCLLCHIMEMPLKNLFQIFLDFGAVNLLALQERQFKVMYINR